MLVCVVFAVIMAVVGWWTIARANFDSVAVISGVAASAATILAIWAWRRGSAYLVAGGTLGAGLLFPTTAGIVPMIIAFVLFMLVVTLKLFMTTFEDGR